MDNGATSAEQQHISRSLIGAMPNRGLWTDAGKPVAISCKQDGLTALALSYLALGTFPFLLGWFQLPVALLLIALAVGQFTALFHPRDIEWHPKRRPIVLLVLVLVSCAWSAFGGGSHFFFANPDWYIRDGVLADLVRFEWPVRYQGTDGGLLILRSAIGFFLPPALVGKMFGIAWLEIAVYVWTVCGVFVFLLLLPIPERIGWRLPSALLITVFFSGMDFIGVLIATESLPIFPLRLEWWVPMSYPSLTTQLLWAPNHCLPIWIATLLCLRHRNEKALLQLSVLTLSLTLVWTPFAALGLIPFVILWTIRNVSAFGYAAIPFRSLIAAAAFSLPIGMLLAVDAGRIDGSVATAPTSAALSYPLQSISQHSYLLFVSCEFLLLTLLLAPHVRQARVEFWIANTTLLVLPLLRFGPSNDLGLRLSTTPLIILLVITLQTLLARRQHYWSWPTLSLMTAFLVLGALTPFYEFWRAATFTRTPPDYQRTLAERQGGQPAAHYVGRLDSTNIRYLIRQSKTAAKQP